MTPPLHRDDPPRDLERQPVQFLRELCDRHNAGSEVLVIDVTFDLARGVAAASPPVSVLDAGIGRVEQAIEPEQLSC